METPEFEDALERLRELAQARPTAILCAEAVPLRCHRQLIADALAARGRGRAYPRCRASGAALLSPHAQVLAGAAALSAGPPDQIALC